ncbi:MAG: transcriptional regulator [Mesorhizobium sp.]|nr:MAG: transcriptional regulator [Mesorhizobium sp.]
MTRLIRKRCENIRPIKGEADYDWAIAEITKYFGNEPEVGSLDGDRFDVLATLIETYEDKHYPIEAPDPLKVGHRPDGDGPFRIRRP